MKKSLAFTINQPPIGINAGGTEPADTLLGTVVGNAIMVIFILGAILLIFYLLWGGIDWIMSGGDKEKVANARKKITSALIGLVILAFTFFIASILGRIVGFNPLQEFTIPTLGPGF